MIVGIPLDTSIRAVYEDGFVLDETEHDDCSPYGAEQNVFHAILNHLPEAEHGRMVSFSCFWQDQEYSVDWTTLPDNARPIRFRKGYCTRNLDGTFVESGWSGVDFGWQATVDGRNVQEVLNLR